MDTVPMGQFRETFREKQNTEWVDTVYAVDCIVGIPNSRSFDSV
jgi:hypothetical protein